MKRIFVILFFLGFVGQAREVLSQSITWEKIYGNLFDDGAYTLCETSDGNFITAGFSAINPGTVRTYVLKINQYGDTLWTKIFNSSEYAYSVVPTNDNGCVLTGRGLTGLYFLKIDSNGNTVWERIYPIGAICYDLVILSNGDFAVCGNTISSGFIMRTDSLGDIKWQREYQVIQFNSIVENEDSTLLIGGFVRDPADKIELLLVDAEGNTIWERRHSILKYYARLSIIKKKENGYFISGTAFVNINGSSDIEGRVFFSMVDKDGYLSNTYILEKTGTEILKSADILNPNKFVLSSIYFPRLQNDSMYWITRICDSVGNTLTKKLFSTAGYIEMPSILPLENSDILFSGIFKPIPHSNNDEVYIVRTDSMLNSKPVNINLINEFIPAQFKLYQNFPNPFNPSTTIRIDILKAGFTKLNIYSLSGQKIGSLINQNLLPGSYDIIFDVRDIQYNISSGIYLYELVIENKHFEAKKMILIK
ncbi:MAG TPA: T9SS type A sorting domain-containing protein [Ignavibacteria bacterium]|nr:T9SS type A sorting domain-containing protein [Ignavibacteria bacterium]HRJ98881.1 T9SS type A sorting domain-containing protein [Ignavibacteria bacterium]